MKTWCHLPTIFNRRHALRTAGLIALCVAITTTLFLAVPAQATAGINQTLSFQGRLLTSTGGVVPDGYYNMQFKIYQDGTESGGGTLKWTEDRVNNGGNEGVQVTNGYFSVNLGSKTAFGTSVDWNQDTLWLSMNIGGSSGSCSAFGSGTCTADGEMLPMKRLTSVPSAINSSMLGGKKAESFVQLGQGAQIDTSNTSSIFINKTGTGSLIQLQNNSADVFSIGSDGNLTLGAGNDHTISVAHADGTDTGDSLTLKAGDSATTGGDLVLAGGDGDGTDSNGGNVVIDGGASTGSGTAGEVLVGTTNASGVTIGRTGTTTVILGILQASSLNVASAVQTGGTDRLDADGNLSNINNIAANGQTTLENLEVNGQAQVNGGLTVEDNGKASASFSDTAVQIGNGTVDSSLTLLVLDQASSAPAENESILGSMYYDTTLGKVQCFEATGWGACGASPDNFVSISPQYTNAVINGIGNGTMTSDLCSDALDINDGSSSQPTICGTNETYNFYDWTSTDVSDQTRSIYVTYQLPSDFKEFVAGTTSLIGRTDSSNSSVSYQIYRNDSEDGLVACGSATSVSTGAQSSWQKATASGSADPSNCGFSAGDGVVIKINLTAKSNANAYVSSLAFTYSNQ